ncbi:DUF4249 domain-containing protein [Croceivirga lutea]|uniref:DUF4249 domain-containing protein n=1 Tax=Croceivirga lutea TaxID=1775167 RepID=UPI00163AAA60|nr:DUF4249 domain-containing protein [Croceivirga lutea]
MKNTFLIFLLPILFWQCVEPVPPEFELVPGLVFVEGIISTEPGASFVSINESAIEFGVYRVNFVQGARVTVENVSTGATQELNEIKESYLLPRDFAVNVGEQYRIRILMPNGKTYESKVETVREVVPISEISVNYNPELEFRETIFGPSFVPGHRIQATFTDPPSEGNNYYLTFRTFENLEICERCFEGYYRDEECQRLPQNLAGLAPYYDYPCESQCWRIRYPENVSILQDEFVNGNEIQNFIVGNALLYTKQDMVVEVNLYTINSSAYRYYKTLKDLVENNRGVNAPPAAPLLGNMFNPNDDEDFVFGRFTAVATSQRYLFVDRTEIEENQLETTYPLSIEPTLMSPLPPPPTISALCSESKYRTAIAPPEWQDN